MGFVELPLMEPKPVTFMIQAEGVIPAFIQALGKIILTIPSDALDKVGVVLLKELWDVQAYVMLPFELIL